MSARWSRANAIKLKLSGVFLSFAILAPLAVQATRTTLPPDPYWRYQGQLIAQKIATTGAVPFNVFDGGSYLYNWVSSFVANIASPVVIVIVSDITGLGLLEVQMLPLFAVPLVLCSALFAYQLRRNPAVFVAAIIVAVSFRYGQISVVGTVHRTAIGWTLFFCLLAYSYTIRYRSDFWSLTGFFVIALAFLTTFQTLVVGSILFISIVVVIGYLYDTRVVSPRHYGVLIGFIVVYYGVVFRFIETAGKLLLASVNDVFRQISEWTSTDQSVSESTTATTPDRTTTTTPEPTPNQTSTTTEPNPTPNQTSTTTEPPQSERDEVSFASVLYNDKLLDPFSILFWIGNFTLIGLAITTAIIRAKRGLTGVCERSPEHLFKGLNPEEFDIVLVAVACQGMAGIALMPFFATSGGYSPGHLAMYFAPIFGGYLVVWLHRNLSHWSGKVGSRHVMVLVIIIAVAGPAALTTIWKPLTERHEMQLTSVEERQQVEWTVQHVTEKRIVSDFNTLSAYYALNGKASTYLPPPGHPAYSTDSSRKELLDTYYGEPASVRNEAGVYVVTQQLLSEGMVHLNNVITKPNPNLETDLGRDSHWNQVYDNGKGSTFVTPS